MRPIGRKIDPNRRMQRQHPFDVYRVLLALRLRDQLTSGELAYYTSREIAQVLYTNFDNLLTMDQNRVMQFKLDCPLRCLKNSTFVEEHTLPRLVKDYFGNLTGMVRDGQGSYRARENIFNIRGWKRQQILDATEDSLDRDWSRYINRCGPSLIDYGGYPD